MKDALAVWFSVPRVLYNQLDAGDPRIETRDLKLVHTRCTEKKEWEREKGRLNLFFAYFGLPHTQIDVHLYSLSQKDHLFIWLCAPSSFKSLQVEF